MPSLKIVFIGTGAFAVPSLQAAARAGQVRLVVSQPPRKARQVVSADATPVSREAQALGLTLRTPDRVAFIFDELRQDVPDIIIVADYGQQVPLKIISLPPYGSLNIHPSLLPEYRGPSPIQAAILDDKKETGVTIMLMDSEMDHGPILAQVHQALQGTETAPVLKQRLAARAAELVRDALPRYVSGALRPHEQNHRLASYCPLIRRSDGELRWDNAPNVVERQCRAYQPWPGVWFKAPLRRQTRTVKLLHVRVWPALAPTARPGSFFWQSKTLGLSLERGALAIDRLQVESGRPLSGTEFYQGYRDVIL